MEDVGKCWVRCEKVCWGVRGDVGKRWKSVLGCGGGGRRGFGG